MIKEQGKKGIFGLLACLIALLLMVADVLAAETRGLSFSYPVSNYSPDYQAFGNKNRFINNNKHLISQIIEDVEKIHGVKIERESIVSALSKKVMKEDRFVRAGKNTFALR